MAFESAAGGVYDVAAWPADTSGGELVVPNATSYVLAPGDAAQDTEVDVATAVAPVAGDGLLGFAGGATFVVNDHTGPAVEPLAPLAVICQ